MLVLVTAASAALFLTLSKTSGPPGTSVKGHTGGTGAFPGPMAPLPTYFVSQAIADSVTSPNDPRLVLVGQLQVDAHGDGIITFVVPSVPPGPFALMVSCPSCGPVSAGRVMLPVGEFQITSEPADTAVAHPGSPYTLLGVFFLVGAGLSMLRFVLHAWTTGDRSDSPN